MIEVEAEDVGVETRRDQGLDDSISVFGLLGYSAESFRRPFHIQATDDRNDKRSVGRPWSVEMNTRESNSYRSESMTALGLDNTTTTSSSSGSSISGSNSNTISSSSGSSGIGIYMSRNCCP
ncbi:hypothetical protein T01_8761 [Trichinella spiralis]|uniref:Uncharacterized protein n=1 Tax=Trichinella spiralis TaxID=6334 RepID=A0A0V1BDN9_TRISP|nr:hypothetical protein T01_8761 [Trichinella spiralis]